MKLSVFEVSFYFLILALLGKLLVVGFSLGESLAALAILCAIMIKPIVEHNWPKRQDLFKEMHELKIAFETISQKQSEVERDVTALKFGAMRK